MTTNTNMEEHFPLCTQHGADCSMISQPKIRQLVLQNAILTPTQITQSIQQHLLFLQSGGAGGKWKLIHIKGIVVAIYFGKENTKGKQASFERQQLPEKIDLQKIILPFSNFCSSSIKEIDFQEANLSYSILTDVEGQNANFQEAQLAYTDFTRANLQGANFKNANLIGADFENCKLTGADFRGANLVEARFPGATLKNIRI